MCMVCVCVCVCAGRVSLCICVFVTSCEMQLRKSATRAAVCLAEFALLPNAKAISAELRQMMGFSNQCHSVCKAFKLCSQSQRVFGQIITQLMLLVYNGINS